MSDLCVCGRERRAECPGCGKSVRVEGGKLAAHEHAICTGSHMQYRSCPKSGAPLQFTRTWPQNT